MNRCIDWTRTTARLLLAIARDFGSHTVQVGKCIGRRSHRFVHKFEPWGIILTLVGLVIALIAIVIDLEDRQSERTFRAWQVVWGFESHVRESNANPHPGTFGSALRQALEFLNRKSDGFLYVIPKKHKESLAGFRGRRANLSSISLTDADLTGTDLTRANLTGADLTGANLTGADLPRANLTGADLTGANLTGADLPRAVLPGANLTGAVLKEAVLTEANLTRAVLTRAVLPGANLTGANLTGANLTGANLTDADLTGAVLAGGNLTGAVLAATDLTGANLTRAVLGSNLPSLTQSQLDVACGTSRPLNIPARLKWKSEQCRPFIEFIDDFSSW